MSQDQRGAGVGRAGGVAVAVALAMFELACVRALPGSLPQSERVRAGMAPAMGWISYALRGGESLVIETAEVSSGARPVLHLLRSSDGSTWSEVAFAKTGDDGVARLSFTSDVQRTYALLVRAEGAGAWGRCRLIVNGKKGDALVPIAGWRNVSPRVQAGEELALSALPEGPQEPLLAVLDAEAQHVQVAAIGRDLAAVTAPRDGPLETVSGYRSAASSDGRDQPALRVRLVQNDAPLAGHDADNDGLGDLVEASILTCSRPDERTGGFDCALAADPRDSDGDGLSDRWEVIGHPSRDPLVALVRFGADPRHKDLFLEMDYARQAPRCTASGQPAPPHADGDRKLTAATARALAEIYEDRVGRFTGAERTDNALALRNPDGAPGIRLHLDTGVPPQRPADATLYGDWGGYSAVPCYVRPDGSLESREASEAAVRYFSSVRANVFRYGLGYPGGGGSARRGWAASLPLDRLPSLAHELGHTLDLLHEGEGEQWGNCRPNYPSVMNYAFHDLDVPVTDTAYVGFSAGRRPALDGRRLQERRVVSPADSAYLDQLQRVFELKVDRQTGDIDWDRDGVFSELPVWAYANFSAKATGCEGTVRHEQRLPVLPWALGAAAPSLVRFDSKLAMLFKARDDDKRLRLIYGAGPLACTAEAASCQLAFAEAPDPAALSKSISGAAAVVLEQGGQRRLLAVAIDADGDLFESELGAGAERWSSWRKLATPAGDEGSGEPSLIAWQDNGRAVVMLAYRGRNGGVRLRSRSGDAWSPSLERLTRKAAADSSPALLRAKLPWDQASRLYLAMIDEAHVLSLWRNDGNWRPEPRAPRDLGPAFGKPAMVMADRFYLFYSRRGQNQDRSPYRFARSYVDAEGELAIGLDANFRNEWFVPASDGAAGPRGVGLSVLYEEGVDDTVRGLFLAGELGSETLPLGLYLYPRADGRVDAALEDSNDWAHIARWLCGTIGPAPQVGCLRK